eukprot:TRINITY_DN3326_c0_g1_i2.p1 TRINITY_DN3326_c0_g1~~TRINITY_DN3326_c0_g1_i2.p1  ORF type:complete len:246 (+),score=41.47 TRINITY_DN3326_c0_g1_i2:28-738(+)
MANVVKDTETCTLNIALHPLVIINISDHFTRQRVRFTTTPSARVFGALLGIQSGRNIEIFNSFELVYANNAIDTEYFATKLEQMKSVFPNYDCLGWYSTGNEPLPSDTDLNKQVLQFNENPLYLLLDTAVQQHRKELPITIYESELRIVNDVPTLLFRKAPYKIETGEAERIAVDHVAHVSPVGNGSGSMLISHLGGMHDAIKMLNIRIKIIQKFIEATEAGENERIKKGGRSSYE